jgi:hypothetical protein
MYPREALQYITCAKEDVEIVILSKSTYERLIQKSKQLDAIAANLKSFYEKGFPAPHFSNE